MYIVASTTHDENGMIGVNVHGFGHDKQKVIDSFSQDLSDGRKITYEDMQPDDCWENCVGFFLVSKINAICAYLFEVTNEV